MLKAEQTITASDFAGANAQVISALETLEPGGSLIITQPRAEGASKVAGALRRCDGVSLVSESADAITFRALDPAAAWDWWNDRRRG